MKIKWKGDLWGVKYHGNGYARYALERDGRIHPIFKGKGKEAVL